jgi:hypothetical protein
MDDVKALRDRIARYRQLKRSINDPKIDHEIARLIEELNEKLEAAAAESPAPPSRRTR